MVFNMFKGLSRLLSRKSAKTVPPVVGFKSAEPQQDEAELLPVSSLSISAHQQGLRIMWHMVNGTEQSAIIQSHAIDVHRLRREIAGSGGFYIPGGIGSVHCLYTDYQNSIINNGCSLPVLLTRLEQQGVIRREGFQLFLGNGVTLL